MIHIFRKDARHFAIGIVLFFALMVTYAASSVRASRAYSTVRYGSAPTASPLEPLILMILPLSAWLLIAMAIQDEVLPGDTQFWITRPYDRRSLLSAKVLFVLVFVNLPLLFSDIAILSTNGLWAWSELPDLLVRQLAVSLWLVIPPFAIASVTRGLAQFTSFLVVYCVGAVILATVPSSFLHEGIALDSSFWRRAIVCGSVLLVLAAVNAYVTRRVLISRVLIAVAFFSVDAPQLWAILTIAFPRTTHQIQPLRVGHQIGLSMDVPAVASERARVVGPDFVGFDLPVHLSDLQSGVTRVSVLGKALISGDGQKAAEGDAIEFQVFVLGFRQPSRLTDKLLQIRLKRLDYIRFAGKPAKLQVSVGMTAFRDVPFRRIPFERRSFEVAGIGTCQRDAATGRFVCRTALREPKPFVFYFARGVTPLSDLNSSRAYSGDSMFPVFAGLGPVDTWQLPAIPSDSDSGLELVFLKPGKPIPMFGSASGEIRVPDLGSGGQ
jgi:hypothetical protein